MNVKTYCLIALAMLALDWALGAAHARGMAPLWRFAALNFPFGLPFVWLESHWVGVRYSVAGRTVNELWSFGLFFFAVLGQAGMYYFLFRWWRARRRKTSAA